MRGNLTGQRFGRLTVEAVEQIGVDLRYCCRCDCGRQTVVLASNLRSGHTRSCGAGPCRSSLIASYDAIRRPYAPTRPWA